MLCGVWTPRTFQCSLHHITGESILTYIAEGFVDVSLVVREKEPRDILFYLNSFIFCVKINSKNVLVKMKSSLWLPSHIV